LAPTLPMRGASCIRLNCALEQYLPLVFCACQSLPLYVLQRVCIGCIGQAIRHQFTQDAKHSVAEVLGQLVSAAGIATPHSPRGPGIFLISYNILTTTLYLNLPAKGIFLASLPDSFPVFRLYTRNIRETTEDHPRAQAALARSAQ